MKRFVLAITGTTGVILGISLLRELLREHEVHLIVSNSAIPIMFEEVGVDLSKDRTEVLKRYLKMEDVHLHVYKEDNLWVPIASGSFKTEGMFVVPCSMKTLSAIANGYASGLVERVADVTIKEGRPLILCPRETPLSTIHLENLLKLSAIGVRIVPPVIGFYHKPATIEDMVDFIVGKLLDQADIDNDIYRRWQGGQQEVP